VWIAVAAGTTTGIRWQLAARRAKRGLVPRLRYNLFDFLAPALALTVVILSWPPVG
jgi:hypothetical protein